MKKLILLVAVLLAVAMVFVSCTKPGEGSSEIGTKAAEATGTKEESTTAKNEPAETHEDEIGKSYSELHPAE